MKYKNMKYKNMKYAKRHELYIKHEKSIDRKNIWRN